MISLKTKLHPLLKNLLTVHFKKSRNMVEVIFIGTFFVACCLMIILVLSVLVFHNTYVVIRLGIGGGVLIYLFVVWFLIQKKKFKVGSWLLILLYSVIATSILVVWGINAPIGVLMLAFVIFLSSVMLGPRYIIPVTLGVVILLISLQFFSSIQLIRPDKTPFVIDSSYGDVASYGTIFGVYALIAWIAGSQREQALKRTRTAEANLQKERDLLEVRLDERTKALKEIQIQETRQLYRFAGLGQLTTVILHELANNLSVLNLDIDDLKQRSRHSKSITRVQESIDYMDDLVEQVRKQLRESDKLIRFNCVRTTKESVQSLQAKALKMGISLEYRNIGNKRSFYAVGDPLRLSQCIIILINNALDAYSTTKSTKNQKIVIQTKVTEKHIIISIIDYGPGVPDTLKTSLFKPLSSTKQNGLGIGLFIAKEVVVNHFKGKLELNSRKDCTEFMITLNSPEN